ncbi:MAG: MATE family efflux transporter [Pseudohongiella sp.]|nr:MATE family efflux transporter [Pseudohongiella sp.]
MTLRYRDILQKAWPVVLANASIPLLGLSDTAVIGNLGTLSDLGAIAFGAVIFSFVYWGFGFLRMGTTGFVAQAVGARDEIEVRAAFMRALIMAVLIGVLLILIQSAISTVSLGLLQGSDAVETITRDYITTRIWGAPAALVLFAISGCLIGLGMNKTLLMVQLVLNGLNIVLDILFAGVWGMGAQGIALGTAVAEWATVLLGLCLLYRVLRQRLRASVSAHEELFIPLALLRDKTRWRQTLTANGDIMIRTLLLVASFAWFVRQSAQFGDDVLAANHILLQLISFSAFFLDAFAYVAEALVGEAAGAKDVAAFDTAVRKTTELSGVCALGLAVVILFAGNSIVPLISQHELVIVAAANSLPFAALYVALAFAAFQLDGIFIGTTRTREMRNASVVSALVFFALSLVLIMKWQLTGLWLAFIVFVGLRALCLGWYLPALRRSILSCRET